MKDRSYHESAIVYNEGLAKAAEAQADSIEHPIPKKWNNAVAKQHRFHEKRHRAALEKERALGQKAIEVAARKREIRNREAWKKGHEKHYKFVDECPHCTDIKAEQERKKAAEGVERVAAAMKSRSEEAIDLTRETA